MDARPTCGFDPPLTLPAGPIAAALARTSLYMPLAAKTSEFEMKCPGWHGGAAAASAGGATRRGWKICAVQILFVGFEAPMRVVAKMLRAATPKSEAPPVIIEMQV